MLEFKTIEEAKAHLLGKGMLERDAAELAPSMVRTVPPDNTADLVQNLQKQMGDVQRALKEGQDGLSTKINQIFDAQIAAEKKLLDEEKARKIAGYQFMTDTSRVAADNRSFAKELADKAYELYLRSAIRGLIKGRKEGAQIYSPMNIAEMPEVRSYFGFTKPEDFDRACAGVAGLADSQEMYERAMGSNLTGYGAELVKVIAQDNLIDLVRIPSTLLQNITIIPITSKGATIPAGMTDFTWKKGGNRGDGLAATAIASGKRGTSEITFTPQTLEGLIDFSDDILEDSIIDLTGFLQRSMIDSLAWQQEKIILFGDTRTSATGNINSDDAAPPTDEYYTMLDGIVKLCLASSTPSTAAWYSSGSGGALALTAFDNVAKRMGKYAFTGKPCVAVNPITAVVVKNLYGAQAGTNYQNVEISGGRLMSIAGLKAIITEGLFMTEADGKCSATASNNVYLNAVGFNGDSVLYGKRRDIRIEPFRIYQNRSNALVASLRFDIQFSHYSVDYNNGIPFHYTYYWA